ncbi:MAG TPA: ribonuclease P protein component [Dongiaceae bacterium]|nr:ribonuclease P protein component [Dongiaceae bacterium]
MIGRLKRRAEFLQVAAANRKWVAPGLILQVRRQPSPLSPSDDAPRAAPLDAVRLEPVRVGFTASRKVGNSVKRNRARRRLRAVAAEVLTHAEPGMDFVLIARPATIDRDYRALVGDLVAGLKRLKLYRGEPS